MNKNTFDKIDNLFNDADFVERFNSQDDIEGFKTLFAEKGVELTESEIVEFIDGFCSHVLQSG